LPFHNDFAKGIAMKRHLLFGAFLGLICLLVIMSLSRERSLAYSGSGAQSEIFLPIVLSDYPTFMALDYGPFRVGQAPDGVMPTVAEVSEDMQILASRGVPSIRTYGACATILAEIPSLADNEGLKVWQGINLGGNDSANGAEINCGLQLQSEHDNISALVVGGEVLLFDLLTKSELIAYVNQVKQDGSSPVTTGESWGIWCNWAAGTPGNGACQGHPDLANAVDFILVHTHPYWEGIPIEQAAAHVAATVLTLRTIYLAKEIVIGETGWPTCGDVFGNAQPGVANQQQFVEALSGWSQLYDFSVLYFEAFDEPWKGSAEGSVGPCWGLFNVDRVFKHNTLLLAPPTAPSEPAVEILHPASGSISTKQNCAIPVLGRVSGAEPGWQVKVEVFTDQWYPQGKWYPEGLVPIVDGMWGVPEVFLSSNQNPPRHDLRATLVDATGTAVGPVQIVTDLIRQNDCN
jgi:exo-beta-1,3-glucanase (GH17 family)